jgi:hypothetical protein
MTGVATPPAAVTRDNGPDPAGAKTMTLSLFHVPPDPAGASHKVCGGAPVLATDVVQRANIGMIQAGNRSRLTFEALAQLCITSKMRRHDLDGDRPVQASIARAIHFAHPAGSQLLADLILSQPHSRSEIDFGWRYFIKVGWRRQQSGRKKRGHTLFSLHYL